MPDSKSRKTPAAVLREYMTKKGFAPLNEQ